jgi:membrane fusion protein, multidrug efflux system
MSFAGRIPPRFRSIAVASVAMLLLIAAGCRSGGTDSDQEESASQPAAVVMSVTGARVKTAPMSRELELLGTTAALQHIMLRAPAAGRVLGFRLQNGDRVYRGQVVANILNREVEAAQKGLDVARTLDPSEAPALARSVKRHSDTTGIAVTAPRNAVVAQCLVSSGQIVADLDPLADLIDPRSVYVEAAVPVDDLSEVKPGMSATVTSPLSPGVKYPAQVMALSPSFSQGSATSPARVEFTGAARISSASAPVEVRITTSFVPEAIVIPSAALFQNAANDTYYVFVAGPDQRAHRTPVTVGIRSPAEVQITSGLQPGQIVLTSGGYALSDGLRVNVTVAQN